MTKLKNNSRNKSKRSRKTKRYRKSRKLMGTTKKRRSKMRGGMNINIPVVKLLAALFAVLKTDTKFKSKDIVYGPKDQLDAIAINRVMLQDSINAPTDSINAPTIHEHDGVNIDDLNGLDLNKFIWDIEQPKDLNDILNNQINIDEYKENPLIHKEL